MMFTKQVGRLCFVIMLVGGLHQTTTNAADISGTVLGLQVVGGRTERIEGVQVTATNAAGALLDSDVTDINGDYNLAFDSFRGPVTLVFQKAGRVRVQLNLISGETTNGHFDVVEPVAMQRCGYGRCRHHRCRR